MNTDIKTTVYPKRSIRFLENRSANIPMMIAVIPVNEIEIERKKPMNDSVKPASRR